MQTPSKASAVCSPAQHHGPAQALLVSRRASGRLASLNIHLQPAPASSAWSLVPLAKLAGYDG